MWAYVASVCVASATASAMASRPGGVVRVDRPGDIQAIQTEPPRTECDGCGAPAARYAHHCEYCKRPR